MDSRGMPPLSPSTRNTALIHDSRHLLKGQMLTKLGKRRRELLRKFDCFRPILL